MNQIEIFFSILSGKSLSGASFTAPLEPRDRIDAFIETYNENAKPFAWKAAKVHQKHLGTRLTCP